MMKNKEIIHGIMLHIALICGTVILIANILDWFNPYMNFSGQIRPVEIVQVCILLLLAFTVKRNTGSKNITRTGEDIDESEK